MSNQENLLDIAAQAEQDLNSDRLKAGRQEGTGFGGKDTKGGSTSSTSTSSPLPQALFLPNLVLQPLTNPPPADESGIDQSVESKFSQYGATADYGSHVSGAGNNRDIPLSEGGDIQKGTGRLTKAGDFDQGAPGEGPEDVSKRQAEAYGGDDSVRGNITNQASGEGTGGRK